MKIKNIINESKRRWAIVGDSNPSFKTKGQTEFTWENYYMLKREAEEFDNREVKFVKDATDESEDKK